MSLRPAIYAVDLARFRALLAGERTALLKSAEQWYREREQDLPADINHEMDLLLSGACAAKPESDDQVDLVAALAHACGLDSEVSTIHWGDWKIGAYEDYFDRLKPLLPQASNTLCEFLRSGRAMFGKGIETEWAYYSYLTADEVRQLAGDLATVHARLPELDAPGCIHGFPTEFRNWLAQIQQRNADLWLFAE